MAVEKKYKGGDVYCKLQSAVYTRSERGSNIGPNQNTDNLIEAQSKRRGTCVIRLFVLLAARRFGVICRGLWQIYNTHTRRSISLESSMTNHKPMQAGSVGFKAVLVNYSMETIDDSVLDVHTNVYIYLTVLYWVTCCGNQNGPASIK